MKRKLCSAKEFHMPKVGTTKNPSLRRSFCFLSIFFNLAMTFLMQ